MALQTSPVLRQRDIRERRSTVSTSCTAQCNTLHHATRAEDECLPWAASIASKHRAPRTFRATASFFCCSLEQMGALSSETSRPLSNCCSIEELRIEPEEFLKAVRDPPSVVERLTRFRWKRDDKRVDRPASSTWRGCLQTRLVRR